MRMLYHKCYRGANRSFAFLHLESSTLLDRLFYLVYLPKRRITMKTFINVANILPWWTHFWEPCSAHYIEGRLYCQSVPGFSKLKISIQKLLYHPCESCDGHLQLVEMA